MVPVLHPDPYAERRLQMVNTQLRIRRIQDPRVLAAMEKVPRHEFIPDVSRRDAYEDAPVAIGEGQTISQPYIVAYMLESLALAPTDKVLEIGTGTGYQAALLGDLAREVFTVERHASLAETARGTLDRLGYQNVRVFHGDGSEGLAVGAPYDAIIVAAAAPQIPPALLHQLADDGRLLIPVGGPEMQELQLIRRQGEHNIASRLEMCRFVPLVGRHGFDPPR